MASPKSDEQNLLNNNDSSFNERSPLSPKLGAQFPAVSPGTTGAAAQEDDDESETCKEWVDRQLLWIVAGLGMMANFWVIGSLGNIRPLLEVTEPECWNKTIATDCSEAQRVATSGVVFAGLFFGMLIGGYVSDAFGRRACSIASAGGMLLFNLLIAAVVIPHNPSANLTALTVFLGGFGIALGMEYPSAAAAAAEKAEAEQEERRRLGKPPAMDRGQKVVLPFIMQGVAAVLNSLAIFILLAAFGQTSTHYDDDSLTIIWRVQYAMCVPILGYLLYYRIRYVHDTKRFLELRSRAAGNRGVFFRYYWHRLVGTAGSWCCWDVAFYGVKISQNAFIMLMLPENGADAFGILRESLYINLVAMVGYAAAAKWIDPVGRWRMQIIGFALMAVSFLALAIWYDDLTSGSESGRIMLRLLFYMSQIFGQFGPNATTFTTPAEVFPMHVRSVGHGFSGAWGPGIGGAVGAAAMTALPRAQSFYLSAGVSCAGILLTFVFLPDVSKMTLDANDEFWHSVMARNAGKAANFRYLEYSRPENLSLFERFWWFRATFGDSLELASPVMGRSEMKTDSDSGSPNRLGDGGGDDEGPSMGRPAMSDLSLSPPAKTVNRSSNSLSDSGSGYGSSSQ